MGLMNEPEKTLCTYCKNPKESRKGWYIKGQAHSSCYKQVNNYLQPDKKVFSYSALVEGVVFTYFWSNEKLMKTNSNIDCWALEADSKKEIDLVREKGRFFYENYQEIEGDRTRQTSLENIISFLESNVKA